MFGYLSARTLSRSAVFEMSLVVPSIILLPCLSTWTNVWCSWFICCLGRRTQNWILWSSLLQNHKQHERTASRIGHLLLDIVFFFFFKDDFNLWFDTSPYGLNTYTNCDWSQNLLTLMHTCFMIGHITTWLWYMYFDWPKNYLASKMFSDWLTNHMVLHFAVGHWGYQQKLRFTMWMNLNKITFWLIVTLSPQKTTHLY